MKQRFLIWPIRLLVPLAMTLLVACGGGGTTANPTPSVKLVSIAVTPNAPSFAKGTQQQLTAKGSYSDGTTKDLTASATWGSSSASVASVTKGMVSALTIGSSTISASAADSVSGTTISGTAAVSIAAATLVLDGSDSWRPFGCPGFDEAICGDRHFHRPYQARSLDHSDLDVF